MTGLIGTCQQLKTANASAGGPTNVSIATSSSGNYNNSFKTENATGSGSAYDTSGSQLSVDVILTLAGNPGPYQMDYGSANTSECAVLAYLRATGAATYSMQGSIDSSSLSFGCAVAWQGSAFTSQDGTGSGGIGYAALLHGGGRGGILLPADGDWFKIKVTATATDSGGSSTNATSVVMTLNFVDA